MAVNIKDLPTFRVDDEVVYEGALYVVIDTFMNELSYVRIRNQERDIAVGRMEVTHYEEVNKD